MNAVLFSALLFGIVFADPQVVWLKSYSTNTANNVVNVESGGKLYLASNDMASLLQKITVQTGNNVLTLDQLMIGNGIALQTNQLTITSTNDPTTAATISGYLYATSAAQANDNTFDVTIVSGPQNINKNGAKSTLMVLNTKFTTVHFPPASAPTKTTYVTDVTQNQNTDLNFHYGYPGDDYLTRADNQFFENPQYTPNYDNWGKIYNKTRVFFESVEPIQVNLPYWYITANGPFSMNFDSTYDNLDTHNTTKVMTTGAYVLTDVWKPDYYVNFVTDPTRYGNTGVLLTTNLQSTVNATFGNAMGNAPSFQSYGAGTELDHAQLLINMASKSLHIQTSAQSPGTMYYQYFVYPGDLLPTTVSPPTTVPVTTPTIATSTKSSRSYKVFLALLVSACTLW